MRFLRADTSVKVAIGPFVDVGDGFTPETGITLGGADEAELIKHDASGGTDISARTWAALSTTAVDGYYNLTLTTTDTDTEGQLLVVVQDDSVCLPVRAEFIVLSKGMYDSWFKNTVITGACTGSPSTTASNTDLTGYADNELIGRTIIFQSGTADGQASDITDYANTNGVVTYTLITTAPSASDTFIIV